MRKSWIRSLALTTAVALMAPVTLLAQKDEKTDKGDKGSKEVQQITITRKGEKKEKVVVVVDGDKITVNGKPIEDFKDKDGDIVVRLNKLKDLESLGYLRTPKGGAWSFNGDDGYSFFGGDENRAMLGVTTDKADEGAKIADITEGSAAAKAGLKEDDIITKVEDKKITGPDDLSEVIKKQKPGDKVSITYLRDKKENKTTAELTRWKGIGAFSLGNGQNFKIDLGDLKFDRIAPKIPDVKVPLEHYRAYAWSGGSPKLGLSVQDTDDGKGVKVIDVDEEGNAAKAGIKEDDVITHLDDKAVNSVDEISRMLKEKKDSPTVRFQLKRNGKSQNIEVKMPRKIKTTDL
jgi:serine protease Do